MWRVAGRMMAVFVCWGLVLAACAASGLTARGMESMATCAAGLTLVAWGMTLAKQQRRIEVASTESTAPVAVPERASN